MKVLVCASRDLARRYHKEIEQLGIEVIERRPAMWRLTGTEAIGPFNAVVLELDALSIQQRRAAIANLQQHKVCVIGLLGMPCDCPWQEILEEDLDGLVTVGCGAMDLACALWSAQRQCELRHVLTQRVEGLQFALQRRKRIEHAKAVIAETLSITEADALKHLRREARNRRRPMHDVASVVIEAHEILCNRNPRNGAAQRIL